MPLSYADFPHDGVKQEMNSESSLSDNYRIIP